MIELKYADNLKRLLICQLNVEEITNNQRNLERNISIHKRRAPQMPSLQLHRRHHNIPRLQSPLGICREQ